MNRCKPLKTGKDSNQLTAVTTKTTNIHGDELIVTTTSPYEQARAYTRPLFGST